MDRKKIPDEVILQIYDETIRKFKREHPNFFDAKLIISPLRTVGQKLVNVLMQDYGDLRVSVFVLKAVLEKIEFMDTLCRRNSLIC